MSDDVKGPFTRRGNEVGEPGPCIDTPSPLDLASVLGSAGFVHGYFESCRACPVGTWKMAGADDREL